VADHGPGFMVGVKMPPALDDPAEFLDDARALEGIGVDAIWLPEAIVRPATAEARIAPEGHGAPPALEPWTLLAGIAAATHRVRLGVSVSVLPMWPPILFAAVINSLDQLSGGRTVIGAGAGWEPAQFLTSGISFDARGRALDDFIPLLRHLLSGSSEPFAGNVYNLPGLRMAASLRGCPPILVGGGNDAAFNRAVKLGDGFILAGTTPEDAGAVCSRLQAMRLDAGKEGPFQIWAEVDPPTDRAAWHLARDRWRDAGVSGVIVQGLGRPDWRQMLTGIEMKRPAKITGIRLDRRLLEILN
jgi:alkanesulfonate monooxygenase SsuD/methylene tetrahydromethanopterin reductase-like flavin-dependent oxidoreductase (luciferase family)